MTLLLWIVIIIVLLPLINCVFGVFCGLICEACKATDRFFPNDEQPKK